MCLDSGGVVFFFWENSPVFLFLFRFLPLFMIASFLSIGVDYILGVNGHARSDENTSSD